MSDLVQIILLVFCFGLLFKRIKTMAATQADLLAAQQRTADEAANLSLQVTNLIARIKNRLDLTQAVANETATAAAVKQAADAVALLESDAPAPEIAPVA